MQLLPCQNLHLQTVVVEKCAEQWSALFLLWERRLLSGERCKVLLKSTPEATQVCVALALLAAVVPSSSAGLLNKEMRPVACFVANASLLALTLLARAVVVPSSSSAGLAWSSNDVRVRGSMLMLVTDGRNSIEPKGERRV